MARIGIALRWLFLAIVGALLLTTAAHADCLGFWDLSGSWAITQTNGFSANFELTQTGKDISGTAKCCVRREQCKFDCQFQPTMEGDVVGHVDGDEFTMTAHWNGAAGGEYKGHITERGIEGDTRDLSNPGAEGTLWYGNHPVTPCTVTTPPSQAETPASPLDEAGVLKNRPGVGDLSTQTKPTPPPVGGNPTATVIADVDVYKLPGGQDKDKIGILYSNNKTTKVSLIPPCENNWCHVKGAPVPTGEGFVYSGTPPDFQSLQF